MKQLRNASHGKGAARSRLGILLGGVLAGMASLAGFAAPAPPAKPPAPKAKAAAVQYNRDIRPILSDNCFPCHGPDKNKRAANYRLDIRAEAIGRGVIVPGRPEKSRLIERVFNAPPALLMPPLASHKTLSAAQKDLLKRWIAEGARYEAHWAYIPPKRPAVPALPAEWKAAVRISTSRQSPISNLLPAPKDWIKNPVDAFILDRLLKEGLTPSPEAEKRTLLRRVHLDLTGIPPTPEEVKAFLADESSDACEKVVDRLLASPHFGERMAAPWLDVVRYADTVGFHGDQNQNAWAYRDYVIDSFNANKPFDQFTIEQLAGDLLPNATPEQRAATAFNRLTMMTREGGAQPKEYLAKYNADRVRTVGMTWLGATFACAECHDHKFDPITQKDFYSLAAFFADVKQWGVYADYGYTPNPDLRGYNNDFPFPPEVKVESRYLKERIARDQQRITQLAAGTEALLKDDAPARAAYSAWRAAAAAFLAKCPDGWETPALQAEVGPPSGPAPRPAKRARRPAAAAAATPAPAPPPGALPTARAVDDGSVTLTGAGAADLDLDLEPKETAWIAALRVELLPEPANGGSILRAGMDAQVLTLAAAVTRADGREEPLAFRHASANLAEPRYRGGFEILGVHGGWKLSAARKPEPHVSLWLPAAPVRLASGERLSVSLANVPVTRVRVSVSPFVPEDPNATALPGDLKTILAGANGAAKRRALHVYLLGTGWNEAAFKQAKALEADLLECRGGITPVLATEAWQPMSIRVLPRGNWQDESGPVVEPTVPHFLPGYQAAPGRRLTRLDLARWIVSPQNPLTARVFANRLWKQFFGNGLSGIVEDLGAQGEWPTHPELLDWLAVTFASTPSTPSTPSTRPWDVKALVRLIVTSATYRQSSSLRPELRDRDPNNRLLASQNPRRLEAEGVRDNALAIAGLLNRDLGGPPCKPYQPADYYANLQFPDRDYLADTDDRQWRRGVYMHWQRTFLHPMLANFDAPSREECTAARIVANSPQQALTLLNDPSFVEASRVLAVHLLQSGAQDDAERLDAAFERALARPAKPGERDSLLQFLGKVRNEYRTRPEDARKLAAVGIAPPPQGVDPIELAAWTSLCRVLLNLQETITRY